MLGQMIGPYRIHRKIGEGGMGAVYEALHEELGRRAAIKVLRHSLWEAEDNLGRFFNEARAANIIQHPGVVSIYEFGKTEANDAYIVMEYLEGESLASRLLRTRLLPLTFVMYIARQIATTLTVVHSKGIVHRDLKPDNVMLCRDSETAFGERTKLLDFGIAKLTETAAGAGPGGMVRTRTGVAMGTPQYMSPEQCAGTRGIDAKTDVYSLGIVLFEMLTNKTPFDAENSADLISMHLYESPPALAGMAQGIPPELDQLIHGMLRKDPTERPTMLDVVKQLEQLGAVPATQSSFDLPLAAPLSGGLISVDPLGATQAESAIAQPQSAKPAAPVAESTFSVSPKPEPWPHTKPLLIAIAGLAGGLLLGTAMTLIAGRARLTNATSTPPTVERTGSTPQLSAPVARWSIATQPAGASVLRKQDGVVLGKTPWQGTAPADPKGTTELMLRLDGYDDVALTLAHDTHSLVDRQLPARPVAKLEGVAATPTVPTPPPTRTPASVRSRGKRGAVSPGPQPAAPPKDSVPAISEPEEFRRSGK